MRRLLPLLLLAACGSAEEPTDNTREVLKTERTHDYVPVQSMDDALRVEATVASRTVADRVRLSLQTVYRGDLARMKAELTGPLTSQRLEKIGLTEGNLRGAYFVAGDYKLAFEESKLIVTSTEPGTRGYTRNEYPLR